MRVQSLQSNYFIGRNHKKSSLKNKSVTFSGFDYSDYRVGQALRAQNKISFGSLSQPKEITHLYNKKVEGKDHLELKNLHIYEYPDTNLRVIVDENENMQNDSTIEARLYLKNFDSVNDSVIKKTLCKKLFSHYLTEQISSCELQDNNSGFYTISAKTNAEEKDYFKRLNSLIVNPKFSDEILQIEKQKMIEEIQNTNFSDNNLYILSKENNIKSKESCIDEINKISLEDLNDYYKNAISNSAAEYYVTLNKNIISDNDKSNLLKDLNSNVSIKFSQKDINSNNKSYVVNDKAPIFIKDESVNGIEFVYPYAPKDLRDCYIAHCASLILLFLSNPFVEEKSGNYTSKPVLISNKPDLACEYYNLKFCLPKPDFTNLSAERALKIQKEIIGMVNDTDYTVTLDDIKQTLKEGIAEIVCKDYQPDVNNKKLYDYGKDIFQIYEIIDSIDTQDVKQYIERYLINQEPIVRYDGKKVNKVYVRQK